MMSTVLRTHNLTKEFAAIRANHNVSISLQKGEILGMLGENGAGKSTLMNLLYGLFQPTSGEIYICERLTHFRSPKEAIKTGLGMVHQHFMLVETLTISENIILGNEPASGNFIKFKQAKREVETLARRHNLAVDPEAKILNVSVGIQQRVEILKALYRKAEILILDEPTAVLTPQEADKLFEVMRSLSDSGVSIILITHKLHEIKDITDRVYVMRRGEIVDEAATKDVTIQQMANSMVGREVKLVGRTLDLAPGLPVHERGGKKETPSKATLRMEKVAIQDDRKLRAVHDLTLEVASGEIVGIAGVDGNGQAELAEGIVGLRRLVAGKILYEGQNIKGRSISQRIQMHIGYVPADRHKYGLVLPFALRENAIIGMHTTAQFNTCGVLKRKDIDRHSRELVQAYDVRPTDIANPAENLSGGNQQKMILAREFSRNPRLMVIAQPTRGLDIGAIEYIHQQILEMRKRQVAILLISLELEEIFALSDRILVLHKGAIVHEALPDDTTPNEIGLYMACGANVKEREQMASAAKQAKAKASAGKTNKTSAAKQSAGKAKTSAAKQSASKASASRPSAGKAGGRKKK